jgi:branched-chain amino acid transport system permease protein
MITLAIGQIVWGIAYRPNNLTGGDNGLRYPARPAPFGIDIQGATSFYYFALLVFAVALFFIWRFSRSAVRREPHRRARPAAPDEHARPPCLADPPAHLRDGGLLGVDREHPVRLLQPVSQPARDGGLQQSAEILLMAILGGGELAHTARSSACRRSSTLIRMLLRATSSAGTRCSARSSFW